MTEETQSWEEEKAALVQERGALLQRIADLESQLLTAQNDRDAATDKLASWKTPLLPYQHQIRDQRLQLDGLEQENKALRQELERVKGEQTHA